MIDPAHRQRGFAVRFDWGLRGAAAIAPGADIAVIVDVLSFTTTLSVAIDGGTTVIPWAVHDDEAAEYARRHDAVLAVRRRDATEGDVSLSPVSLRSRRAPSALVLPSPNGSTIAARLATEVPICVGASLRNARAVAAWITDHRTPHAIVSIVAAGEKWPDGGMRPAVEDLWGAGYVVDELTAQDGPEAFSPEAVVAGDAWSAARDRLPLALADTASGRELIQSGYRGDVDIAGEIDSSTSVPLLRSGRFVNAAV